VRSLVARNVIKGVRQKCVCVQTFHPNASRAGGST